MASRQRMGGNLIQPIQPIQQPEVQTPEPTKATAQKSKETVSSSNNTNNKKTSTGGEEEFQDAIKHAQKAFDKALRAKPTSKTVKFKG